MAVETALYPSQFNTNWPTAADMVSEGDDHLRLIKTVDKTTWPNVAGAVTASHIELNYLVGVTSGIQGQLNAKGAIAGQTWSGAHSFSGSVAVPTMAAGDNTTNAASTAFVSAAAFASALPLQTGNAGKFVTTDGVTASWASVSFTSLSGKPTTVSGYGITDAVTTSGAQTIAGDKSFSGNVLLTGSGGIGYSVGSGGTVTQATSKTTAVTLNKPCGQITTSNAALAAGASAQFQVNNTAVTGADGVVLNITGGTANASSYRVIGYVQAGAFFVRLTNESGVSLSDSVVINFQLIKGSAS